MLFRIANMPVIFQAFVETMLEGLIDVFCIVYIDNILIFSDNHWKYTNHICQVLEHFCRVKLFTKQLKYVFYTDRVQFLGFYMLKNRILMEKQKVKAIKKWLTLKSVNNIQIFLRFTNFYQQFIHRFSQITTTLIEHLKKTTVKKVIFCLLTEGKEVFNTLKKKFLKVLVLVYFNSDKLIQVKTDTSEYTIRSVLTQPAGGKSEEQY